MITLEATRDYYQQAFGHNFDDDRGLFLECLYKTCIELPKPATVLEVGTFQGKSAFVMACALHGTGSRLICVDPIFIQDRIVCTDAHHAWSAYETSLRDVLCRLSKFNLAHIVSVVPGFSEWVFNKWDGTLLDMVLVDGAHTEPQVALDARWSQYVKPGGYCLYDDWIEETERAAEAYYKDKPEWELVHKSTAEVTPRWAISAFRRKS